MGTPATPTLQDVIDHALTSRLESFFTMHPGRIVSYDAARRECSAQPIVRQLETLEDGAEVAKPLPVIPAVPVLFLGGGGFATTYPVKKGDLCILLFSSCSLDTWLGVRSSQTVDPADRRRNHLTDAIALVGLQRPAEATPADATRAVFGDPKGARLRVDNGNVIADDGAGGVELALKSDVQDLADFVGTLLTGGSGSATVPVTSVVVGTSILKGK